MINNKSKLAKWKFIIGLDQMSNHRRLETLKSTHSSIHLFERINVIVV